MNANALRLIKPTDPDEAAPILQEIPSTPSLFSPTTIHHQKATIARDVRRAEDWVKKIILEVEIEYLHRIIETPFNTFSVSEIREIRETIPEINQIAMACSIDPELDQNFRRAYEEACTKYCK